MIELVKFCPLHWEDLVEQKATRYLRNYMTREHVVALAESRFAYAGLVAGRTILCAGVVDYWPGRGEAWAMLHEDCKKHMLEIHLIVRKFLNECPINRLEAVVDAGFEAGHRWVRNLGFKLEAPLMKGYRPDGGDCSMYARVK